MTIYPSKADTMAAVKILVDANVAAGAKRLDDMKPGWASAITTPIVPEMQNKASLRPFVEQLGIIPPHYPEKGTTVFDKEGLRAFFKPRSGEAIYVSPLADEMAFGENIIRMLVGQTLMPIMEGIFLNEASGLLDAPLYGYMNEPIVYGVRAAVSGYLPQPSEVAMVAASGYCVKDADQLLADAWNREIAARQEGK